VEKNALTSELVKKIAQLIEVADRDPREEEAARNFRPTESEEFAA